LTGGFAANSYDSLTSSTVTSFSQNPTTGWLWQWRENQTTLLVHEFGEEITAKPQVKYFR